MNDADLEAKIKQAGYEVRWEDPEEGGAKIVYALRDGKRHTRSHSSLQGLAEYLGRVERPVTFVDDTEALETVIAKHAREPRHFLVRREACRVAVFNRHKYVQLVSAVGDAPAMYEVRTDGLRRTSNGNLPPEVVTAFRSDR
jgi:hypothetical protein